MHHNSSQSKMVCADFVRSGSHRMLETGVGFTSQSNFTSSECDTKESYQVTVKIPAFITTSIWATSFVKLQSGTNNDFSYE